MPPYAFLLPLAFRSVTLLLPLTFFQPDEFYQALEPAHQLVFGYGHLTWEWKDLPIPSTIAIDTGDWWTRVVVGGRMRGWFWPSAFAGMYRLLQVTGLDQTEPLVLVPRAVGVLVAALTDYSTYRLARKLLGSGAAAGALFLSLTSLFNAHLLPRSLSTSPETLLTTLALLYFPLPVSNLVKAVVVGEERLKVSKSLRDVKVAESGDQTPTSENGTIRLKDPGELNHALMDRMDEEPSHADSLELSVLFAALAICIRPTTLPFWGYMATELLFHSWQAHGPFEALVLAFRGILTLTCVVIVNTAFDDSISGRLMLPTLTFIHRNVFANISSFYGGTHWTYHLVQSLPIMLFPIWFWWIQGFLSCLLPRNLTTQLGISEVDQPRSMQTLARALTFGIAVLSLSAHSEWRFLHPFLPVLLIFALLPMFRSCKPNIMGCWRISQSIRQYTRLPKSAFYACLFLPILPWLYLNMFHGRAQVEVMHALRRGAAGNVTGLVALMPCHSTPWQSHLHKDVEAWFLTCEPPLDPTVKRPTQQDLFYAAPVKYLETSFPAPPGIKLSPTSYPLPSHVILFGDLLSQIGDSGVLVDLALRDRGYEQVWSMWNGFDFAQDETRRRGGVRIWSRTADSATESL